MPLKNLNILIFITFSLLFFLIIFPISNFFDLGILVLFIILIFYTKKFTNKIFFDYKIIFLFFLIILNLYLNNFSIIEKNGIFLPNQLNENQYKDYNPKLYKLLKSRFKENYKNTNIICKDKTVLCWENTHLNNIFSENFTFLKFMDKKFSYRKVKDIDHYNLSSAKIGMINKNIFNWSDWLDNSYIKRKNAPYFTIYKFHSDIYENSHLCWKGEAIIIDKNLRQIINNQNKCLKITSGLEIILYNFNSNLEVFLDKNYKLKLSLFFDYCIKFLILFFFIKIFISKINTKKLINPFAIIFVASLIIFYIFLNRENFQYGYFPLDAGMDGLVHEGYSKILSSYLINLDFKEFLRGNENIFYFMPGLRYVFSLKNLFFDFNHYFTFLIIIFFPILIYHILLELKFSNKFSIIFCMLFILLKIPYVGFSYSHFARSALTLYPETYAAFCFFIFLLAYLKKFYFVSSFFCFLMVFIRPNYLTILVIYLLFQIFQFHKYKEKKMLYLTLLGLSFFLFIPLHNYFYSNGSFVLLTNSAFISVNLRINLVDYIYFFNDDVKRSTIINHLTNWLTNGEINNFFPYIINSVIFINTIIYLFFFQKNSKTLLICLMALSIHSTLFFYPNTGRYGYFPWFLLLLSNICIIKDYLNLNYIKNFKL